MKRAAIVALLVGALAAAGGAWLGVHWLLRNDAAAGVAPDPVRQRVAEAPTSRSASPQETAESPHGPHGEGSERTALGSRVELRVVDKASGRALPGARVRAGTAPGSAVRRDAPCWALDTIDGWMDGHGAEVALDAEGTATLSLPDGSVAVVVGEAPGLWGRAQVRADATQPQVLELEPDASVAVRVVDAFGAPCAGVPVALRARRGGWSLDRMRRPCDADGRVELAHIGPRLRDTDDGARWSIAADVLLTEPVEEELDLASLPVGPVVLVLPATGAVEVTVLPLPGGPPLTDGEVSLVRLLESSTRAHAGGRAPDAVSLPLRDGPVRFERVGLGLELSVEATVGESSEPTRLRARGPVVAGEVKRLQLRLGSDHPVLRMRLVDADGRPLADARVLTQLEVTTARSRLGSSGEQSTDAEGVLYHDLPAGWAGDGTRTLGLSTTATPQVPASQASIDLARPLPDGLVDLGDVVLASGLRLAAGRVEDSADAPVAGARVRVQVPHAWAGDRPWFELRDELGTTADGQGGFEVHGSTEATTLRLTASAEGYAGEPVEVRPGTTGVVLRLRRAGSVEGRLLLEEGLATGDLAVQLEPASSGLGSGTALLGVFATLADDGTFRADPLLPGTYDLFVRTRRAQGELASVEGLVVPEGGPCADPRLEAIDLRGRACSFTLELVPPRSGMPVTGVVIYAPAGADPGGGGEQTRPFSGEQVRLTAPAPALDLEVLAPGFRRVRLEGVRSDVRVDLEEGLPVRLRLPAGVVLPDPPRYLEAFVGREEDFWKIGPMQEAVFGADRELLLHVLQPGELRVVWMLEEHGEGSVSTSTLGYDTAQTIEVRDVGGEQVFEVAPDPEAYAQALARPRDG